MNTALKNQTLTPLQMDWLFIHRKLDRGMSYVVPMLVDGSVNLYHFIRSTVSTYT